MPNPENVTFSYEPLLALTLKNADFSTLLGGQDSNLN